MSVGKRLMEAIDRIAEGDPEAALIPVSIAVDATASQEHPELPGGAAYKEFLHDNLALITRVASGGRVTILQGLRIAYHHPDLKPGPDGTCSIEEILYHVVRCGLLHEAALAPTLRFTGRVQIALDEKGLILPDSLVLGLVAAVAVSPANRRELADPAYGFFLRRLWVPFNEIWGRKEAFLKLLDEMMEVQRAETERRPNP